MSERDLPNVFLPDGEGFDAHDFKVYSDTFVKLPVEIQALRLEVPVTIRTLEGDMKGEIGDWLIRGINGEFYPCKDDIFKKTYRRA